MDIALWVVQGLLAFEFVMVGQTHAFRYERGKERLKWMEAVGKPLMTFIGICEILGAIGLILPALTGILPWLTPLAATLLGVMMVLAAVFHIPRREYRNIGFNIFLLAQAAFVAYGRFALAPK